jgi:hypothetical protein
MVGSHRGAKMFYAIVAMIRLVKSLTLNPLESVSMKQALAEFLVGVGIEIVKVIIEIIKNHFGL